MFTRYNDKLLISHAREEQFLLESSLTQKKKKASGRTPLILSVYLNIKKKCYLESMCTLFEKKNSYGSA